MSHRIVGLSAIALGLPLAAACSHSSNPPPAEPAPTKTAEVAPATAPECEENAQAAAQPVAMAAKFPRHHVLNCPMDVPGTTAGFAEIDGYPSIAFETPGDVAGLRHRVHAFLEPQTTAGVVEPGVSADTQGAGGTQMKPDIAYVGTKVRFDDLPDGVRATFVPADDGQARSVAAAVAAQVDRLDQGDCSDMHIHGVKMKDVDRP